MRYDFLKIHERVPQVNSQLDRNPKFPPQLNASHGILCRMLEDALLRCSDANESTCCLLELEKVLDTLYETPVVSPYTRPQSRGTVSFQPQVKKSPVFPSSTRDEALFHCTDPSGVPRGPSQLHSIPDFPWHHQKLHEITVRSLGNPWFPVLTRERP